MKTFKEYFDSLEAAERMKVFTSHFDNFFHDRNAFEKAMNENDVEVESEKSKKEFIKYLKMVNYICYNDENVDFWIEELENGEGWE